MTWNEVSGKLKDTVDKETVGEVQMAMADVLPSIKDDYDLMEKNANELVSSNGEVERLKGLMQERAMSELVNVTQPEITAPEENDLVLGDDVLQEIIDIHNDKEESDGKSD